jgi:hypothetical protein
MSIEAFLNAYGVEYLGEDVYNRKLERLSINQKLKKLLATCKNKLIDDKAEISIILRRLFERRNQIVHPKASEFDIKKYSTLPKHNPIKKAEQSLTDTKQFYGFFVEYDDCYRTKLGELIADTKHFDVVLEQLTFFDDA